MSPLDYRSAIVLTETTIRRRAALFRIQGIALLLVIAAAVVDAIVARRPATLLGLGMLLPLCGGFLLLDANALRDWRRQLFAAWTSGTFDFVAFFVAIRALPYLPQRTVEGMLATLPDAGDLSYEQRLGVATRRAIAAESEALRAEEWHAMQRRVVASACIAHVIVISASTRRWVPASGVAAVVVLPSVAPIVRRRRRARTEQLRSACEAEADFSGPDFDRMRALLR